MHPHRAPFHRSLPPYGRKPATCHCACRGSMADDCPVGPRGLGRDAEVSRRFFASQRRATSFIVRSLGTGARRIPLVTALSLISALCQVVTLVMLAAASVAIARDGQEATAELGPLTVSL